LRLDGLACRGRHLLKGHLDLRLVSVVVVSVELLARSKRRQRDGADWRQPKRGFHGRILS
jgi:hypothetical protein